MPVTISKQDYWDLVYEAQRKKKFDAKDRFDIVYQYPEQLGQGAYREIELRQGMELAIESHQLHDDLIVQAPERSHLVEYVFRISGISNYINSGQYALYGSGIAPIETWSSSAAEPIVEVNVHIEPKVFQAFLGDRELASMGLGHLMRENCYYYDCLGTTTVAMQTILHQILHCPFQGITKKIYLESKV